MCLLQITHRRYSYYHFINTDMPRHDEYDIIMNCNHVVQKVRYLSNFIDIEVTKSYYFCVFCSLLLFNTFTVHVSHFTLKNLDSVSTSQTGIKSKANSFSTVSENNHNEL